MHFRSYVKQGGRLLCCLNRTNKCSTPVSLTAMHDLFFKRQFKTMQYQQNGKGVCSNPYFFHFNDLSFKIDIIRKRHSITGFRRAAAKKIDAKMFDMMESFRHAEVVDVIKTNEKMGMLPSHDLFRAYMRQVAQFGETEILYELKHIGIFYHLCTADFWDVCFVESCRWNGKILNVIDIMWERIKTAESYDQIRVLFGTFMRIVISDFPEKMPIIEELVQEFLYAEDILPILRTKPLAVLWKTFVILEEWDKAGQLMDKERAILSPELPLILNDIQPDKELQGVNIVNILRRLIDLPEIRHKQRGILYQKLIVHICKQGNVDEAGEEVNIARSTGVFREPETVQRMINFIINSLPGDAYKIEKFMLVTELEHCLEISRKEQQKRLQPLHDFLREEIEYYDNNQ